MQPRVKAHVALSFVSIIYGANYIIAKSVMPDPIGPTNFIVLRVLGAVLLFWLIAHRHMRIPDQKDWGRFILCGLTGVAINQIMFFNGLSMTSPINSSIIMTSNPILVMVISSFMLRQEITAMKVVGVTLGAIGAILLLLMSTYDNSKASSTLGDLFILLNSMSYGFYLVLVKPLMSKYHPMMIITWVFTIGLIAVLPFGGLGISSIPWSELSGWQWFSVFFVIVCVTFLTYLLNTIALSIVSPTTSSAYIYLQPILAALFAWIFTVATGNDYTGDITWLKVLCGTMIFAGVYLVGRSDLKKQA